MSRVRYPRNRIESALLKGSLPASCRIMPARHLTSPLGSLPADSRFCSRDAGYTVLYASPDSATAFVETVVRDRFTRRRNRDVGLKEITGRGWTRISGQPGAELTLLDLRGAAVPRSVRRAMRFMRETTRRGAHSRKRSMRSIPSIRLPMIRLSLFGAETARRIQLGIEYAPNPPFDSGTPERAGASVVAALRGAAAARQDEREAAVEEASARVANG